jgi:hypothetical protein
MENESPEDFKKLTMVGIDILKFANDDDVESLDKLC